MRMAANEKAEAEKILQIKKAEGEAECKYVSGLGIARQRQAIVDGLRDSVVNFSETVSVFIPHGPGAVRDIATQIGDGLLQGQTMKR